MSSIHTSFRNGYTANQSCSKPNTPSKTLQHAVPQSGVEVERTWLHEPSNETCTIGELCENYLDENLQPCFKLLLRGKESNLIRKEAAHGVQLPANLEQKLTLAAETSEERTLELAEEQRSEKQENHRAEASAEAAEAEWEATLATLPDDAKWVLDLGAINYSAKLDALDLRLRQHKFQREERAQLLKGSGSTIKKSEEYMDRHMEDNELEHYAQADEIDWIQDERVGKTEPFQWTFPGIYGLN